MPLKKIILPLLLIAMLPEASSAQWRSIFQSLVYPHSITAGGSGEQGVAFQNPVDAMQYNPANLVFSDNFSFSFFNNPWNIFGFHIPLTDFNLSMKLKNGGTVGLDYSYFNYGDWALTTVDNPDGSTLFHEYERSLAAGYAMPIGDDIAVGGAVRYAWRPVFQGNDIQHLLFSAGASYIPETFSNRVRVGFSLMNFSTRVKIQTYNGEAMYDAPPAQINLGSQATAVTNDLFDVTVSLGIKKPVTKYDDSYNGESSFSALFNDWGDFPNDVTAQFGLAYRWHPVNLGAGISYFQEMYLGYFTVGPKEYIANYLTHGVSVGFAYKGIQASAGYAGRWHNFQNISFIPLVFPWETFQFTVSSDLNFTRRNEEHSVPDETPKNIIVAGGFSYGEPVGKMKNSGYMGVNVELSIKNIWCMESDFYFSENSALHTVVQYSKAAEIINLDPTVPILLYYFFPQPDYRLEIETVSFESGYRYHPFEMFHPLFVQGSIGIIRMNPIVDSQPKYSYQSFTQFDIGCVLPITNTGFVVMPAVGLQTYFLPELPSENRLGGYNQFTFGVSAGYEL